MIYNNICPYCSKEMVLSGSDINIPNRASVEHLIPHVALSRKRGKAEGDFRACKTCNCTKSNLDYVIGAMAKMDYQTLKKAIDDKKKSKRYVGMIYSANINKEKNQVEVDVPISEKEISEYATYLAKGQYFKEHKKPLNLTDADIYHELIPNHFINKINKLYLKKNNSFPFDDLKKNPRSEVILNGECIIYSKNNEYMFVFQYGLIFIIKVHFK